MASNTFRDSMNSLGWSRRDADIPVNTTSTSSSSTPILSRLRSLNPFGDGGYVRLPTHENPGAPLPAPSRREEEEGWFACECDLMHSGFLLPFQSIVIRTQFLRIRRYHTHMIMHPTV